MIALIPGARLTVFSFREEPHEPPFLDAIAARALAAGGEFVEARQVGGTKLAGFWADTRPDLLLSVSWRYLVSAEIYLRARTAAVFHDALLPAYRGFSPTVWAILNGEDHTGVTLFHMDAGTDDGDIIDQLRVPIGPEDTIAEVMDRVTDAYINILDRNATALLTSSASRIPQNHARATYTCKRLPEDNQIDWSAPTQVVYNLIRATTAPYPGAFTTLDGRRLTVWAAAKIVAPAQYIGRVAGRVVSIDPERGVTVLTGDGQLLLTQVQLDSESAAPAAKVVNRLSATLGR